MEITYIEKGMLEWMVEGVPKKMESGSIFFTLPWQVHGSLNPTEPDNTIWHVLFHLEEDLPPPAQIVPFPGILRVQHQRNENSKHGLCHEPASLPARHPDDAQPNADTDGRTAKHTRIARNPRTNPALIGSH